MRVLTRSLPEVRSCYRSADRDLLRILLNSSSYAEANLALGLLKDSLPHKTLVAAVNLREVFRDLPTCPFGMAVDMTTLVRAGAVEPDGDAYVKRCRDTRGGFDIILAGEGNYCHDLVLEAGGRRTSWSPYGSEDDLVDPEAVDLVMETWGLLRTVVRLVQDMGLPFYPTFYLSLEDWKMEYVENAFTEIADFFRERY